MYLKSFGQKETLLDIIFGGLVAVDILDTREAAIGATVFLEGLGRLPAPLAVARVMCQTPQDEVGLDHFGSQDVVFFGRLQRLSFNTTREAERLGTEFCFGAVIRLVTSIRQVTTQLEVALLVRFIQVMATQRQHSTCENTKA